MIGAYPGSFNPPTLAHLAVADAARRAHGLERVDLVVSQRPLDKEHVERPLLEHRLEVLERTAARLAWLDVHLTHHQLLVDIAAGYDVLILGADKWHQLHDERYYASSAARDAALVRLPTLAVAPRPPWTVPAGVALEIPERFAEVSSTRARAGARELMAPEAAAFDVRTGAWTEPDRYERWLAAR